MKLAGLRLELCGISQNVVKMHYILSKTLHMRLLCSIRDAVIQAPPLSKARCGLLQLCWLCIFAINCKCQELNFICLTLLIAGNVSR